MAKALVGHVQESGQALGLHHLNHLVPLRCGDVVARGVVTASMQDHDGACGCRFQGGEHAFKVDAAFVCIVVGIGVHSEARLCEQGTMVFPAGVADQHFGSGQQFFQEVGANFQAACAAQALDGGHAAAFHWLRGRTEDQALDGVVVGRNTVNRQVPARRGLVHHGFFRLLNALQQGQFAVVVEINAHTQVHFVGVGVCGKLLIQSQDGIAGRHLDASKHRHRRSLEEGLVKKKAGKGAECARLHGSP